MTATLQFKNIAKDRLFYNRWQFCMGFELDEATCLRELSHARIDDMIQRRQIWREIAEQRWKQGHRPHSVLARRCKPITTATVANLHELARVLLCVPNTFKLVVIMDEVRVYTNDLGLIDQLSRMPILQHQTFARAVINRARDTVQLQNPQHAWRTYLRRCQLDSAQQQQLLQFLTAQKNHVRLSPSLKNWLDKHVFFTMDYFFVDHDSKNWCTMLSLVVPGIVRKTLAIVATK